jgi:tetratricopeptide (TPR) repeat protein
MTGSTAPTVEADPGSKGWPVVEEYQIEAEVGRGGMGVVYRAREKRLGRVVALKTLPPDRQGHAGLLARLRQEAQALGRISDPHVVPIYELGDAGELPYFTMEWVAGVDLGEKLRRTSVTPEAAARLTATLARTMHRVHTEGSLLHRDLKPRNILLQGPPDAPIDACVPKVTDFGLAKPLDADGEQSASTALLGTPSYMAPEQVEGKLAGRLTPAVDVWALGAVLYECLTGRPPFRGSSPNETLLLLLQYEPVAPRLLQPGVPRDLETICLKCLQKEPGRRYSSADALADDLERFLAGRPIQARPTPGWERLYRAVRRHPAAAALVLVSVLALVAVLTLGGVTIHQQRALIAARDEAARQQAELNAQLAHESLNLGILFRNSVPLPQPDFLVKEHLGVATRLKRDEAKARSEEALTQGIRRLRQVLADGHAHPEYRQTLALGLINLAEALAILRDLAERHPENAVYRTQHAATATLLGGWHKEKKRWADADAPLREATDAWAALARDYPDDPENHNELAGIWTDRAGYLRATGGEAGMAAAYAASAAAFRHAVKLRPDNAAYRTNLAQTLNNLAIATARTGQADDRRRAVALCNEAMDHLDHAGSAMPQTALVRRNVHAHRAALFTALGQAAEALADWDRAVALSTDGRRDEMRLKRARDRARLGDAAGAKTEADAVVGAESKDGRLLLLRAEVSLAAGSDADRAEAVTWLRRAAARGAFGTGDEAARRLEADPLWAPLRSRADFQRLVEEVRQGQLWE